MGCGVCDVDMSGSCGVDWREGVVGCCEFPYPFNCTEIRTDEMVMIQLIVPAYGAFLAVTLINDFRQGRIPGMPAMPSMGADGEGAQAGMSKRQQKMEKRGGRQRVVR